MFFTALLRAAKPKSRNVVVLIESMASGHTRTWVRERAAEKAQIIMYDPLVQTQCLYQEIKKIKGIKYIFPHQRRPAPKQEIEL